VLHGKTPRAAASSVPNEANHADSGETTLYYLVTGAESSLGVEIVKQLLSKGNSHVFAAVHDYAAAGEALTSLREVDIVKLAVQPDLVNLMQIVSSKTNRLDMVIVQPTVFDHPGPTTKVAEDELRRAFELNCILPLALFRAVWPSLRNSKAPKFYAVTGSEASISKTLTSQSSHFGPAFALTLSALHMALVRLADEHHDSGLVCVPVAAGVAEPRTVAAGLTQVFHSLTTDDNSKFWSWDGTVSSF